MCVRMAICRPRRLSTAVCDIHQLFLQPWQLALRNSDNADLHLAIETVALTVNALCVVRSK